MCTHSMFVMCDANPEGAQHGRFAVHHDAHCSHSECECGVQTHVCAPQKASVPAERGAAALQAEQRVKATGSSLALGGQACRLSLAAAVYVAAWQCRVGEHTIIVPLTEVTQGRSSQALSSAEELRTSAHGRVSSQWRNWVPRWCIACNRRTIIRRHERTRCTAPMYCSETMLQPITSPRMPSQPWVLKPTSMGAWNFRPAAACLRKHSPRPGATGTLLMQCIVPRRCTSVSVR